MSNPKYDEALTALQLKMDAVFNKIEGTAPIGYETLRVKYNHWGEYVYFSTFVVSFGQRVSKPGFKTFVGRMWANNELIYDRLNGFIKPGMNFQFFDGNDEQGEVYRGMHYRGLMVGLFTHFDLTDYNGAIPSITAELLDAEDTPSFISPDKTKTGVMHVPFAIYSPFNYMDADNDTLYRSGAVFSRYNNGVAEYEYVLQRVRMSTKTLTSRINYARSTLTVSPTAEDNITFVPPLKAFMYQSADDVSVKVLVDVVTGKEIGRVGGTNQVAHGLAYTVTAGGVEQVRIIGAGEGPSRDPGTFTIFNATSNDFRVLDWQVGLDDITQLCILGKAEGYTDVALVQGYYITRVRDYANKGFDLELVYSVPADQLITQVFYDRVQARMIVFVETNSITHEGYVVALDDTYNEVWRTEVDIVPSSTKRALYRTQESTGNFDNGSVLVHRPDDLKRWLAVSTKYGEKSAIEYKTTLSSWEWPLIWDSRTETAYVAYTINYEVLNALDFIGPGAGDVSLEDTLRAFATHVGYEPENIITTNLDGMELSGYLITQQTTLGQLSTTLGQLYGFSWLERTGDILYKGHYSNGDLIVDLVVPPDHLAVLSEGGDTSNEIGIVRSGDDNFPKALSLTYYDIDAEYTQGFQRVTRSLDASDEESSRNESNMSLPIVLTDAVAVKLLYGNFSRMWAHKRGYNLRLPPEYQIVDPGDVITFTANHYEYTAQITKQIINGDWSVSLDLADIYGENYPVEVEPQGKVKPPSRVGFPVRTVILDIPNTSPAQDKKGSLNLLVLMAGYAPGTFSGGVFEVSDGSNWNKALTFSADDEAYIGTAENSISEWYDPFTEDTYSSLYVQAGSIPAHKFTAASTEQLEEGANLIAVGEGSEVELIQFRNVELVEPGTYRLYGLLRGRFGTDVFMHRNQTGAPVSFLDKAMVLTYSVEDYANQAPITYRGYNTRQPAWQVDSYSIVPTGASRKPYAPVEVVALRATNGDITINYQYRNRFENTPPDALNNPGPLDDDDQVIILEIYNSSGEVVRRKLSLAYMGGYLEYPMYEQVEDGYIGVETHLTFAIYQQSQELLLATQEQLSFPVDFPLIGAGFGYRWYKELIRHATATLLRARMALEGDMGLEISTEPANLVRLSANAALGGDMVARARQTALLWADFAAGGDMRSRMTEPVEIDASIDLGGAMGFAIAPAHSPLYTEYLTAEEFTFTWPNLTGWAHNNVQVADNALYGTVGTNPAAAVYPFEDDGGKIQFSAQINKVAGNHNNNLIGLVFGDTTPVYGSPNFIGIGIGSNSRPVVYVGTNFDGTTGSIILGTNPVSGAHHATITMDEEFISLSIRTAGMEYSYYVPRTQAPNMGKMTAIQVYNGDIRGLSGTSIGPIGVKRSLTPFRNKSDGGVPWESEVWPKSVHGSEGGKQFWIQLPPNYSVLERIPTVIHFHQSVTGTERTFVSQSRSTNTAVGLSMAGYIVVANRDLPDMWGNQEQVENTEMVMEWITTHLANNNELFLYGASMGGASAYNVILHSDKLRPRIKAMVGIGAVADLQDMYNSSTTYRAALLDAYDAVDAVDFAAKVAPYNPLYSNLSAAYGIAFKHWVSSNDSTVSTPKHTTPMTSALALAGAIIDPTVVSGTGHLPTQNYDATAVIAFYNEWQNQGAKLAARMGLGGDLRARVTLPVELGGDVALGGGMYVVTTDPTRYLGANMALGGEMTAEVSDPVTSYNVTIPPGKVGSNLTNFPLYVRLADMPLEFWDKVSKDGGNIRVTDLSGAPLAMDLAIFEPHSKKGTLFVKTNISAAGGATVKVRLEKDAERLPFNDPYGRNAVWADFDYVTLFGFDVRDRTGNFETTSNLDPDFPVGTKVHTFTNDPHQGGTFDGTYHYIVDTNAIYKYDRDWNLIASNTNPIADTGLSGVNHLGDPCNREGVLYIPLEFYSGGSHSNHYMVAFDTDDLTFISSHALSAGKEISSVCYCDLDGLYYVTDYVTHTIQKYNSDWVHQGAFTFATSGITKMQGIEWYDGAFWIVDDNLDEVMRVEYDGTTLVSSTGSPQGYFGQSVTGNLEGIWRVDDSLYVLSDPSSAQSFVTAYKNRDFALSAGGGMGIPGTTNPLVAARNINTRTSWTIGVSGAIGNKTANRNLISYLNLGAAATSNTRVSLSYQNSSGQFGLWDSNNTWLYATPPFNPNLNDPFRLHVQYDAGIARRLFIDGVLGGEQVAPAAQPNGLNGLFMGYEDTTIAEPWRGLTGYVYLRNGILSADWIAAEYANLADPSTFYSVSGGVGVITLAASAALGGAMGADVVASVALGADMALGGAMGASMPGGAVTLGADMALGGAMQADAVIPAVSRETPVYANHVLSNYQTAATSRTIAVPSGVSVGDLLIVHVSLRRTGGDIVPPAGWNTIQAHSTDNVCGGVYYRIADGTEPADYTFSWVTSSVCIIAMLLYKDTDPTNPIHMSNKTINDDALSIGRAASMTTTEDNTLLLHFGAKMNASANNVSADSKTGATMRYNTRAGTSGAATTTSACSEVVQAVAGPTGTWEFTYPGTSYNLNIQVALLGKPE
jgi:hypothetical protein